MTGTAGPIVLCFGVVDEADIIGAFIEYHLGRGVDALVATDVGSTDGTLDILSRYEASGRLHLIRLHDPATAALNHDIPGGMLEAARDRYRAEWCLFCDADEFWVFPGEDAHAYFSSAANPIVVFPRCNMVPAREAGSLRIAHFSRFDLVVRRPLEFFYDLSRRDEADGAQRLLRDYAPDILRVIAPKVAARVSAVQSVAPGFHHAAAADPAVATAREEIGYIAHFPTRSLPQWRHRATLIERCFDANPLETAPADYVSRHWVRLAVLFKHNLIEADFDRQVLSEAEIDARLREGVLQRDDTVARRLARLAWTR